MTVFLESPLPILFIGLFVEGLLGVALVHTRRGRLIAPMVIVALLVFGGVLLERLVVTEREQVEMTLDGAVEALNRNDLPAVLDYFTPQATQSRARARWAMERVEFTRVSIHALDIKIHRLTSPPTAEVRLNGVAYYRDRKGEFPYEHYAARFIVHLEQRDGQWRVTDHVEADPKGPWGGDQP